MVLVGQGSFRCYREESIFLPTVAPRDHSHSLAFGTHFPFLKPITLISLTIFLWFCLFLSTSRKASLILKSHVMRLGPTRYPRLISHVKILSLITSAKSLLSCKVILRVPRIKLWMSFRTIILLSQLVRYITLNLILSVYFDKCEDCNSG